jgi:hypothetical protein
LSTAGIPARLVTLNSADHFFPLAVENTGYADALAAILDYLANGIGEVEPAAPVQPTATITIAAPATAVPVVPAATEEAAPVYPTATRTTVPLVTPEATEGS